MEAATDSVKELYNTGEKFGKTTLELARLKSLETSTRVITSLLWRISVILTFSLFLLILNIGIALLLGEWLGKSYYGFFIVAMFYLLAGIILHFFLHQWIKDPLSNFIVEQAHLIPTSE